MAALIPSALLLFLLLSASPFLASSQTSPSPSPLAAPSPSISLPPSPELSASPPAPPLDEGDDSPSSSPSPSPSPSPTPSPSPSPAAKGVVHESADFDSADGGEKSAGGMSAGKKVGLAVGIIAAVAFVSLGVIIYRKRQENLQRARYGYNARMMEMI